MSTIVLIVVMMAALVAIGVMIVSANVSGREDGQAPSTFEYPAPEAGEGPSRAPILSAPAGAAGSPRSVASSREVEPAGRR